MNNECVRSSLSGFSVSYLDSDQISDAASATATSLIRSLRSGVMTLCIIVSLANEMNIQNSSTVILVSPFIIGCNQGTDV
jgi:hypothetical protein